MSLTDQIGMRVTSPPLQSIDGPGTAAFGDIDACDLADGIIEVAVGYTRNDTELALVSGTPAVKVTGLLEPPVPDPVPPMVFAETLQVCVAADKSPGRCDGPPWGSNSNGTS